MLTGDEEVHLREHLRDPNKPDDAQAGFQSRPNVLFEAGLAMGTDAKRTILIQIGDHRPFSDIVGRYILPFRGTVRDRNNLASRLENAGCPVNRNGQDWLTVGDFEDALTIPVPKSDLIIIEALYGIRDHRRTWRPN